MASNLCMNCFEVKGEYEVCSHCGYVEGTPPQQAYYLAPGTILDNRYIIGTCIGFGGFGITYKAFDATLSIVVAIKEFYPSGLVNRAAGDTKVGIFSGEKEAEFHTQMERFLDEARNMAVFSKEPDIIHVYRFFEANGTAYTIMEYIDGILLKTFLKKNGKMEVNDAVACIIPILNALEKVHSHNIIHKDISPDNIFLLDDGSVKLFDFGAARFPEGQQEKTFSVVIKAGYAPPEQYRSTYKPGAFMDIYAAGAVLYEMITGVRPSEGSDRAVEDDLEKPSELGIEIDKNLENIIMKAMAVKPELRFQTAAEFKKSIIKNKKVLAPQDELNKKPFRKIIRASIVAVASAVMIMGVTAGTLTYLGRNKLHTNKIKEDTLSVWLVSEEDSQEGGGAAELLKKSFEQNCPNITLDVTEMPANQYEEKIQEACDTGTLPDVFCTDYLEKEAENYCGNMEKLINTIDLEEYPYFTGFKEKKASCYEMPTAIQIAMFYQNDGKYKEQEISLSDTITTQEIQDMDEKQRAVMDEYKEFGQEESPVRMIAGDLSCFDEVRNVTVWAKPSKEFAAAPVLDQDGNIEAVFTGRYGINKDSTENRQDAGMICISFLLNKSLQDEMYLRNFRGLPVQVEAMEQYKQVKLTGYLSFAGDYLDKLAVDEDGRTIKEAYYTGL